MTKKALSFISNVINNIRKWLGWCPEAPEPKGLRKLVRLPFVYVPVFKARLVQVGLIIGVSVQALVSVLGTVYVGPVFVALVEKLVESEGSLPPEEALSALFSLIPFVMILGSIPFVSSGMAGYTVGRTSPKLRYGIIIGITNILLGSLVSSVIGFFYVHSFYTMYEKLLNLGLAPSMSIVDIVLGWVRTSLFLLALGGGGGAAGQLLSLQFGGKRDRAGEGATLHDKEVL